VREVHLVQQGQQEVLERLEPQDQKVTRDQLGHQDFLGLQDLLEPLELLGKQGPPVGQEILVLQEK
jgi:hypothetical protein